MTDTSTQAVERTSQEEILKWVAVLRSQQFDQTPELAPVLEQLLRERDEARANTRKAIEVASAQITDLTTQRDALKALCESICGCVGGKYQFYKQRHGVGHAVSKMLSGLIDEIDVERTRARTLLHPHGGE